jgi:hypothetical protein
LLCTNPPGVSLNRVELKKQMRYCFCAKTFCVLQTNVLGEIFSLSGREWPTIHDLQMSPHRYRGRIRHTEALKTAGTGPMKGHSWVDFEGSRELHLN